MHNVILNENFPNFNEIVKKLWRNPGSGEHLIHIFYISKEIL